MDSYLTMLYVTLEQEIALKAFFEHRGWQFCKPDLSVITDQIGPQVLEKPSVAKHVSETFCADSYRKETASPQSDSNNRGCSAQGKRRLVLDTAISVPYVKVAKVTNLLGHNSAEVHGASKQMYNTNRGDMGKETVEKSFPTDHKSSVVKLEKTVYDISSELNGQSKDEHHSNMNEPAGSGIEDDAIGDSMLGCNATEKRLTESSEMKGECSKTSSQGASAPHAGKASKTSNQEVKIKPDGTEELTLEELMASCETVDKAKKIYTCSKCGVAIKRKGNLKRHLRCHMPNQIRCSICNCFFSSAEEKNSHMLSKHSSPHICHVCGSTFQRAYDLNIHLAKHGSSSKSMMRCPFENCNKIFFRKSLLNYHLNVHSGYKPFKCDSCQREFYSEYSRKSHQKLCSVEIVKCDVCYKEFSSKSSLNEHVVAMHGNRIVGTVTHLISALVKEPASSQCQERTDEIPAARNGSYVSDERKSITLKDGETEIVEHSVLQQAVSSEEIELDQAVFTDSSRGENVRYIILEHAPAVAEQDIFGYNEESSAPQNSQLFHQTSESCLQNDSTVRAHEHKTMENKTVTAKDNSKTGTEDSECEILQGPPDRFVTLSSAMTLTSQCEVQSIPQCDIGSNSCGYVTAYEELSASECDVVSETVEDPMTN